MAAEVRGKVKTEPKPESKEAVVVEENPELHPPYKTWFLKVSVHCEGCKRKVKKILHNIEGVHTADVDLKQQKATVIGNVDAETLIQKLVKKTGRYAALWPEKADQQDKKKGKSKNKEKEKQSNQESSEEVTEKEKETLKAHLLPVQDPPKITENGGPKSSDAGGVNASKAADGGVAPSKSGGVQIKEAPKTEVKQTATSPDGGQLPVADKKGGGDGENGAEKSGGGSGSKKSKKQGHKGNNKNGGDEGEHSGNVPAGTGSPHGHGPQGPAPFQSPANRSPPRYYINQSPPYLTNHSPPRHHLYENSTTHYYAPPVQAVSYNTAHPSSSYNASYYAPRYEYAYMHPGTASEPPPFDLEPYSSQTHDSFEFLSDENPNACSVM